MSDNILYPPFRHKHWKPITQRIAERAARELMEELERIDKEYSESSQGRSDEALDSMNLNAVERTAMTPSIAAMIDMQNWADLDK